MSKIQPMADNILALQEVPKNKTESGILLPEKSQKKPKLALVIAVGQDVKNIKAGDSVIYKQFEVTEVYSDDDTFLIFKEESVLAKITNTEDGDK